MKQSLQRDLENLLNTRRRATGWPADLTELELSLANYGIPDIAGRAELGLDGKSASIPRNVADTIRRFEPRFQHVSVSMLQNADPLERTLRFRIDALAGRRAGPRAGGVRFVDAAGDVQRPSARSQPLSGAKTSR